MPAWILFLIQRKNNNQEKKIKIFELIITSKRVDSIFDHEAHGFGCKWCGSDSQKKLTK